MTKNLSQNYSYANDSDGNLVNISTAQRNEKYFCPICGGIMTPHMGKIRRWHFVHKNNENCSYESYLHKLAKIKICQAFLSSDHFLLSYKAKAICTNECPFVNSPKCEGEKNVEFNLRKYYDTCEIEANYHQFKADLLLSSSTNSKRQCVLIEIKVTHKCTEDKINDGVRIIEIPIHSEDQIENIINSCKLTAERNNQTRYSYHKEKGITLYNFNKVESFNPAGIIDENEDFFNRKNTIVFILKKDGTFHSFDCHCYDASKKIPQNVHYYVTNIATPYKEIFQGFSKRGVKIRNCFLCKYSQKNPWGDRLCTLYKKYNLPYKPSPNYAISCHYYREDFENFQLTDQPDHSSGHKFYYYICKDIL